jgi:hypothetical protein
MEKRNIVSGRGTRLRALDEQTLVPPPNDAFFHYSNIPSFQCSRIPTFQHSRILAFPTLIIS